MRVERLDKIIEDIFNDAQNKPMVQWQNLYRRRMLGRFATFDWNVWNFNCTCCLGSYEYFIIYLTYFVGKLYDQKKKRHLDKTETGLKIFFDYHGIWFFPFNYLPDVLWNAGLENFGIRLFSRNPRNGRSVSGLIGASFFELCCGKNQYLSRIQFN